MKKYTLTLVCMLAISSLLLAGAGAALKYGVLEPLGIQREESVIALPFVLMADESFSYAVASGLEEMMNPTQPPTQPPVRETEAPTQPEVTEPPTQPPTQPPTEPVPTYVEVDESWFDDVLFIGDSRTVGLRDTARLGEADYFCAVNMTVFTVQTWTCSDQNSKYRYLSQVLDENTYGKIYIHLGLNECGYDHDLIMEKYRELVDLVQEKQPDAVIILQSVMTVSAYKAENSILSLERITALNERIEALAQEEGFLYIDTNEFAANEEGYMREGLSYDGAHPTAEGYVAWSQWILENAGWLGIP